MTMCQALRVFFIRLTFSSIMSLPAHAGTEDAGAQRCAALKETTQSNIRITASTFQALGRLTSGGGNSALTGGAENAVAVFPAHCLISGEIDPYTGADGKPYATRFEMRLPLTWNNRLLFQGGGGLDGVVNPAIGAIAVLGSQAQSALERGFAVVSMDGGHTGNNADFAADQQAKLNFAYAAIGQVSAVAKHLIAAFYTKAPDKTYFMGCSNGGREALIAAQRYPSDFDGIVAGDPAFNLGNASMLSHHGLATFAKVAPRGNDGLPVLTRAFSPREFKLVRDAVLQACDKLDGVRDGMIFNQEQCHFDPQLLACKADNSSSCLSQRKIDILKEAFAGPRDASGNALVGSWPYDTGITGEGYRAWRLGSVDSKGNAQTPLADMSDAVLTKYFNYPPIPSMKYRPFDYSKMLRAIAPSASLNDPTGVDLRTFEAKGGKLLVFSGWSDPVFTPLDLTEWYRKLQVSDQQASRSTGSYARLFMVPGMNHCGGGPALDDFDPLTAVVAWVEQGEPPKSIIARGQAFPGLSRPLCPYPTTARYAGKGSTNLAENFVCK